MDKYELVIVKWKTKDGELFSCSMPLEDYFALCESDDVVECYIIG